MYLLTYLLTLTTETDVDAISVAIPVFFGGGASFSLFHLCLRQPHPTLPSQTLRDGGQIPEVASVQSAAAVRSADSVLCILPR